MAIENVVFLAAHCNMADAEVVFVAGANPPATSQALVTLPPGTFPAYIPLHAVVWFRNDPGVTGERRAAIWTGLVNGDGSVTAHAIPFFGFTILEVTLTPAHDVITF